MGDIRKVIRYRWGLEVPNDDAGREDLEALLRYEALHPTHGGERVRNAIEIWASWMQEDERQMYISDYTSDIRRLWPTQEWLRDKMSLSNADRERLKAYRIPPIDMSAAKYEAHKKAKKALGQKTRRLKSGAKPRAESISASKPWIREGCSRPTWYRRLKRERETGMKLLLRVSKPECTPSSSSLRETGVTTAYQTTSASNLSQSHHKENDRP